MDRLPNGLIDLTGQTFGRLTVLARGRNYVSPIGKHRPRWRCLCECGGESLVQRDHLVTGHTRSCGCLFVEARWLPGVVSPPSRRKDAARIPARE